MSEPDFMDDGVHPKKKKKKQQNQKLPARKFTVHLHGPDKIYIKYIYIIQI